MNQVQQSPQTEAQKYALAGAVFGLLFPVVATLVRIVNSSLPYELSSVVTVQTSDSLLWIIDTAPIFLGLFAYFVGQRQGSLQKSNSELKQRESELEDIKANLEKIVQDRTRELVAANQQTTKRVEQLKLIADVARSAISVQDVDRLLPHIAQLISQRFNFYHVGIFLLDEQKQYAILRASNSQGGLRMIKKGHRLRVGTQGIVGYVSQTGQSRIALNVEDDPVYFGGVDLPNTRSEIALPLKSGGIILGVLDIQSTDANAFSEDQSSTLSILADQMAIAIQNAISHEQSQRALMEAEIASRQAAGQAWKGYAERLHGRGYRYDGVRSEPLKEASASSESTNVVNIPVLLRGQTIGQLKLKHLAASRTWTEDELAMAEATAERVALALDNARLLQESQRRAAKEAKIGEVTAKIGASINIRNVLQTAVQELGRALPGSEVVIQFEQDESKKG